MKRTTKESRVNVITSLAPGRLGIAENWNDVTIALLVLIVILFIGFIAIIVYLLHYRKRNKKYDLDS